MSTNYYAFNTILFLVLRNLDLNFTLPNYHPLPTTGPLFTYFLSTHTEIYDIKLPANLNNDGEWQFKIFVVSVCVCKRGQITHISNCIWKDLGLNFRRYIGQKWTYQHHKFCHPATFWYQWGMHNWNHPFSCCWVGTNDCNHRCL